MNTRRTRYSGNSLDEITGVLGIVGLIALRNFLAGTLSHGQKQWLEIGMLLMQRPGLLLVDEPVAGMTHEEMDRTAELLLSPAGDHTVVVVEYDMEFVRGVADRFCIMVRGTNVAEDNIQGLTDSLIQEHLTV